MIITFIIAIIYILLILVGSRYDKHVQKDSFMNIDQTNVMRGLCCLLVVLVHVPEGYTNTVQSIMGGFSQICVTLYFLFSAYGIITSIDSKPGYLIGFWKRRVLALLIPFLISCGIKLALGYHPGSGGTYFVFVLLFFYIVVYFSAKHCPRKLIGIVCGTVVLYSLFGSIFGFLRWPTQALGFAYGALLARYFDRFRRWCAGNYNKKLISTTILAVILTTSYALLEDRLPAILPVMLQNTMVATLILWIFLVTYRLQIGNLLSRYLGKCSYEIFLYHGLVQNLLLSYAGSTYGHWVTSGIFVGLMVLLTLPVSFVMHKIDSIVIQKIKQ